MTPLAASALSVAVILLSRSADKPTCSGVAVGRLWAWATTTLTTYRSAATSIVLALMTVPPLVAGNRRDRCSIDACVAIRILPDGTQKFICGHHAGKRRRSTSGAEMAVLGEAR